MEHSTSNQRVTVEELEQQHSYSFGGFEVHYYEDSHQDIEVPSDDDSFTDEATCDEASFQLSDQPTPDNLHLTPKQLWNLWFSFLAWACTICNVTLVVGTSNVVLLSIDGDPNLSSVPLAAFFLGASLVSLLVTPWHFGKWGRTMGFQVGVGLGLLGSVLGCCAVLFRSTGFLIAATTWFGAAMGIGFYLRFAVVEVVPFRWADRAITLVVSGGCIAAFAGPESAQAVRGVFGPDYEYLGVFALTGMVNLANGVFTSLVHFSDSTPATAGDTTESDSTDDSDDGKSSSSQGSACATTQAVYPTTDWQQIWTILRTRHFRVPMMLSAGSWIIMAVPMSVLRVAMHHVGFSSRQSLLAMELHFLGMFSPGFVSGRWIARFGPRRVAAGGALIFWLALGCMQLSPAYENESSDVALWIVGMILTGAGWNFAFNAATVGSTRSYSGHANCKSAIQAANDGLTFLFAGVMISCASFIYHAGGEGLEGWRQVNWVIMGFIGLFNFILMMDVILEQGDPIPATYATWSAPSAPLKHQTGN